MTALQIGAACVIVWIIFSTLLVVGACMGASQWDQQHGYK